MKADTPRSTAEPSEPTAPIALDRSMWSSFANARSDKARLTGWLAILVNRVGPARLGALIEADHEAGAFVPVAVVPDPRRDLSGLREVAQQALASGRPATAASGDGAQSWLAVPVMAGDGAPDAVVTLELADAGDTVMQAALREVHWAMGWPTARAWERRAEQDAGRARRAAVALDIHALASEHAKPAAAAMAVANEAQAVLGADRVSIGLLKGARTAPRIKLISLSHSAWVRRRSAMVERLETAMEEAFDQGSAVIWPPMEGQQRTIGVAHADHVKAGQSKQILSVVLRDEQGPIGVMSAERRDDVPFGQDDLAMAESIGALVGPLLDLKRRNRRWFGGRIVDGTVHVLGVLLQPRRLGWKLLAVALIALAVAAATVQGPFRIQADAVLRGEVQRAAAAPFAGFLAEAPHRAGDVVKEGDLLARLDDADLRLEALRWQSELDRLTSQSRGAFAQFDRAQVALIEAQIAQARAQLELAEAELDRTRVLAPIDGLIISGDLSQRLGAPVQLGEVLFEIAPEDRFRLDSYVDERDLPFVEAGARARVALAGAPTDGIPAGVTRITPMAEAREGANTFRVEMALLEGRPNLRPGMEGVAKIDAGRALYSWIWTRRLVGWLRETLWTWQP